MLLQMAAWFGDPQTAQSAVKLRSDTEEGSLSTEKFDRSASNALGTVVRQSTQSQLAEGAIRSQQADAPAAVVSAEIDGSRPIDTAEVTMNRRRTSLRDPIVAGGRRDNVDGV